MKYNVIFAVFALLGGISLQVGARDIVVDSLGFSNASATTPANLLEGKVAGLRVSNIDGNVNGALNTIIRGVNSLRSDSQPLWIIDGAIVTPNFNQNKDAFFQFGERSFTSPLNALAYLNEYDIESIEVIKDLSAAAIYGAKGANGVIIVTTKLPSEEIFNVNWRSNLIFGGCSAENVQSSGHFRFNSFSHNHYLNVSGAKKKTKYLVSGYFRKLDGVVDGNNAVYGGVRTNFETKANSFLWFGMNSSVAIGRMNSIAGTTYFGQPSLTLNMRNDGFFAGDTLEGWKSDYDDKMEDSRANASMYVTLNFTQALSLKTTFGMDFSNNNRYIWYGDGTSFGRENNGAASLLGTTIFKYNASSILSWNRFFASDHHVVLNGGVEVFGDMTRFNTINGTDFFSHVLRGKGLGIAASKQVNHKYDHDYFTWGLFADATYSFKNIFSLKGTVRADNTPRYDDGCLRLFKAGELSINLRNVFFSEAEGVSELKLKVGYGEAGREQYVPYGLYNQYISGAYPVVDPDYQMFYEGLNRINSREFNAGLEIGFFSGRLSVSAAYFDKSTNDIFYGYCFGALSGEKYWKYCERQDVFSQGSSIANRGFEWDINGVLIDNGRVKWTMFANCAYDVNQMTSVNPADRYGRAIGDEFFVNADVLGQPVGTLYGYKTDTEGKLIDTTGDGVINDFDKDVIGNTLPKFYGGIGTTLKFGAFTFDVIGNGAFGYKVLNLNNLIFGAGAPDDVKKYDVSEKYIENGDYFRLSRVSVGYNFDFNEKKCPIKSLNLSLSACNLFTITKYSGWDPTVNCFGVSYLSSGVDYGSYPTPRSIVLGVSLNF